MGRLGIFPSISRFLLGRATSYMLRQWLVAMSKHLAAGGINDNFLIAVVFTIDLPREFVPLASGTVEVVTGY